MVASSAVSLILVTIAGLTDAFAPKLVATPEKFCTSLFARRPFITGNWKLNPQSKEEAITLAQGIAAAVTDESPCDVALFVPFPFIECAQRAVGNKITVGAEVSIGLYGIELDYVQTTTF